MQALIWLGKNVGLILGVAEIVVVAVVNILAQVAKVLLGIVNVLAPSRSKDTLVNLAAKIEEIAKWIENMFKVVKKFLYGVGGA